MDVSGGQADVRRQAEFYGPIALWKIIKWAIPVYLHKNIMNTNCNRVKLIPDNDKGEK